jgi:serine protease
VPVEETEVVTTSCPAIPRNVIATGGDNSIVLTWDNPEEGTAAPTAYVATVMPGEIEFRIDAPSTTALLSGLLNGKRYEVYLFAENGDGRSETAGPFLATPTNGLEGVVGRLVVQYEDGVASTEAPGVATGSSSVSGIELVPEVDLGDGLRTVALSEPVTTEAAAQIVSELESDTRVKWAEVDQVVTTASAEPTAENLDPDYLDRQWNMWSDYGVGGSKLFPSTFGRGLADLGKGVTVAVIDTGITKHSDFGPRVLPGYDFVSNRSELSAARQEGKDAVAFDGDYVDEDKYGPAGWDDNALDPGDWREVAPIRDSSWHGTHVAGIIGAEVNNSKGISGLVPLVCLQILLPQLFGLRVATLKALKTMQIQHK